MYFELPSADFLEKGFRGAEAWWERKQYERGRVAPDPAGFEAGRAVVVADQPARTCDGFTLYTTCQGSWAKLLDMNGRVVHRWKLPFRRVWSDAPHVHDPFPDELIHWFRGHLFPNGELLAVYQVERDTPYGYGLAKLDKDSKLVWAYPAHVHHDVDVGENGTVYTLVQKLVEKVPAGLDLLRGPYLADYLVLLSPQGKELQSIPILEAFRDSPYALTLSLIHTPPLRDRPKGGLASRWQKGDFLHTNSVKVLRRSWAAKFPLFKAGQVLISLRSLDTIAVLDPRSRTVVWAARGLWRGQHDAEFLPNGRLLVYDNLGALAGTRVLEYDPVTQAVPWSHGPESSTPFIAPLRGSKQRLANGNTLIVDPDRARILEVTRGKTVVWDCFVPAAASQPGGQVSPETAVTSARRYRPRELPFLKGGPRARP
jgi:hypothetical protein